MKAVFTFFRTPMFGIMLMSLVVLDSPAHCQLCQDPSAVIYGLTNNGAIYPITVSNASVGTTVKSSSYSGNSANSSNGLGYNATNGKFYYFKRDVSSSPQEFVSFDPGTNSVSILATSTCGNTVHTGCVTANGKAYYTIDVDGNLNFYNIITNTWTFITSSFKDQFGNNVTNVIQNQSAGDIAFDGNGNLWIVTSSTSKYALYKLPSPMPTTAQASVTVTRLIDPNTNTPTGNSIAGIAFNPQGQIFLGTLGDNKLYRLENNFSTTFLGNFSVAGVGNDLTSCAFPLGVLPVSWVGFDAALQENGKVDLNWSVAEESYTVYYVEYSQDGNNWQTLSTVSGTGNGSGIRQYRYVHQSPVAGANHYRIRMKDQTSQVLYSSIKMVDVKSRQGGISVWPNPTADVLHIQSAGAGGQVKIMDMSGRLMLKKQIIPGEQGLSVQSLQKGVYMLQFTGADGLIQSKTFIRQ
ncbi:MAG: T9SS type A sorting domain-containing protein [Chitinophagaceae bacterium]|nr:T9SS type A sorting domain-containing protein [Chitinophagaceae bacterium]